ncbi:MAG TPA: acireductone synthase [Gammaproteobacteria bacterium]|nr:acireductone synthase [Gammaproteobacteria bacterium]
MIRAIVTDIEGTTSSLSFVKDVLFPYARNHLPAFIRRRLDDPLIRVQLQAVAEAVGQSLNDDQAIDQLIRWIDEDRKITPLKTLQGMIWETGYRNGDFQGHVYDDAVHHLQAWKSNGIALYVFSSGSVQAQQLLFAHTAHGDLTPLFSGYFDTRIGAKRESAAYEHIARTIKLPPGSILFLSDIREELDAAKTVGFHTAWLIRDGEIPSRPAHPVARNFDAIRLPN